MIKLYRNVIVRSGYNARLNYFAFETVVLDMFKVNYRDTGISCEICSMLTIKTSHRTTLKLGSHRDDHNCQLVRRNLITSDSSPKVRRQSILTNCAHSMLSSSPYIKCWFFSSLVHVFVFISN